MRYASGHSLYALRPKAGVSWLPETTCVVEVPSIERLLNPAQVEIGIQVDAVSADLVESRTAALAHTLHLPNRQFDAINRGPCTARSSCESATGLVTPTHFRLMYLVLGSLYDLNRHRAPDVAQWRSVVGRQRIRR